MFLTITHIVTKLQRLIAKNVAASSIIIVAAVLRLVNLPSHVMFLGDQGRDAIIIKDIATLKHLTLIGAPTSIGSVFLGPFYYYLIAPFLWFSGFNPVGLAIGVALLWIASLIVTYTVVKHYYQAGTAVVFLIFLSFSSNLINFARFSWNPNLLPAFAFFTLLFFYWAFAPHTSQKKNTSGKLPILYAVIFGALFGASLQLHFLAALMAPTFVVFFILFFFMAKKRTTLLPRIGASLAGFLASLSPLLVFDLRHGFINSKQFIQAFQGEGVVEGGSLISRLKEVTVVFLTHILRFDSPLPSGFFLITALIVLAAWYVWKKRDYFLGLHIVSIALFLTFFALINSPRHVHYYGPIYLSFFLIVSVLLTTSKKKILLALATAVIIGYLYTQIPHFSSLFKTGSRQVQRAKLVARTLEKEIGNKPYNIATWPVAESEDPYTYFLDLWGHPPADRKAVEITEQMFVLCFQKPCLILNSPSWNISMFGPAKVVKRWSIDGIIIYKLVHTE